MLTIEPAPARIMPGSTAWQQCSTPFKLASRMRSHSAGSVSAKGFRVRPRPRKPPAQLTSASICLCRFSIASTAAVTSVRWVTSSPSGSACSPIAAATSSARARSMSETTTSQPSSARQQAMPSPIRLPPPVMSARGMVLLTQRLVGFGLVHRAQHVIGDLRARREPDLVLIALEILDHLLEGMRHIGAAAELGMDQGVDAPRLAAQGLLIDEIEGVGEGLDGMRAAVGAAGPGAPVVEVPVLGHDHHALAIDFHHIGVIVVALVARPGVAFVGE